MITAADIRAAYEAEEAAQGGSRKADPKAVLRTVAERLGVTYERARETMLNDWMGLHG